MRRLSDTAGATPLLNPASAAAVAAGVGGQTMSSAAESNASFDANMVIILAALLCVLICSLGLNSVIRCALHCGRRLAPSGAGAAANAARRSAPAGLKKKVLRRIPVEVYGPDSGVPATATECAICLGEFADGEKVRVLPRCHHGFHVHCIDMWLATHSSCPTCRASLAEEGAAAAATADARR